MDVDKERALDIAEQELMDVGDIVRSIFCSCDVDNTDMVRVSQLIEFIKPYLMEDLNALEDLKHSLDPEGKNVLVSSERFYEVMNHWSQKVGTASSGEDIGSDKSPRLLTVRDDRDIPYTHSTPRASLGDKLLKCKDLLNLSNISGYSLSTSRLENPPESEKTVLEEEIKKLEHQLLKTTNELFMTKQQLTASEDQNDQLQQDLERINRRLHAEQQVNEHLQKDIKYSEDLRDEVTNCKKTIEELKKKLSQSEKDNLHHKDLINEMEEERAKLEKKVTTVSKQHHDCLKELFDVRTEFETKEEQVSEITKAYNELKVKLSEQKDDIDQLREKNDLLGHQKSTLEKLLKTKPPAPTHPNQGNLFFDLNQSPSPPVAPHTSSTSRSLPQSPHHNGAGFKGQSVPLLRRVLVRPRYSSTPVYSEHSLMDSSPPEHVKRVPVLSPIKGDSFDNGDQCQDSSEEDLYWKIQQGQSPKSQGQDLNGTTESLHLEMYRADPVNETGYRTILYERDERIAELEFELENIQVRVEELEKQCDESTLDLKEQKRINEDLVGNNFVLMTKEQSALGKLETLKQRMAVLEQNGVIVENQHECTQSDIEDLQDKIRVLEATLKDKDATLQVKTVAVDTLQCALAELRDKLGHVESLKADYDEKLQSAMRDLGELTAQKICLQGKVETLQSENAQLEQASSETFALTEKLTRCESLKSEISKRNKELEEENFITKQDLECSRSTCENLAQRMATMETELKELNNNKGANIARHQQEKANLESELSEFKVNLEKKLVAEFEGKVKYSMDAEEKILHLTQKGNKQENDLKNLLAKFSDKTRALAETQTEIARLTARNELLQKEIDALRGANADLELQLAQLRAEQKLKLTKLDNIDAVTTQVQKHIQNKNDVFEELKQLNRELKASLKAAQVDLRKKIDDILELRNEFTKDLDIKNELWKKVKAMEKDLHQKISEINQHVENHQNLSRSNEELKIEYNNLLIVYDLEVNKNGKLVQRVAQCTEEKEQYCLERNKLKMELHQAMSRVDEESEKNHNLTERLRDFEANVGQPPDADRQDSTSQTPTNNVLAIEEVFSEIKTESDRILEELEAKLNEEVRKNRRLTSDLLKMKQNYTKNHSALEEMERKLSDNEAKMSEKLQENCRKYSVLTKELNQAQADITQKDIQLSKVEMELKHTKENLEIETERTLVLRQQVENRDKKLLENSKLLAEELSRAKDTIDKNEIELSKIANELKEVKEALKEETKTNAVLTKQLEENATKLQDAKQKLKIRYEQFQETSKELEEELVELKAELNDNRHEIGLLKHKNTNFKDALDLIQQENNQLISELKQKLDTTQEQNKQMNKELSEAQIEVARLKEWLSAQERTNNNLSSQLTDLERSKLELQTNLDVSLKEKEELVRKVDLTKQEKEDLNKELCTLKQVLSDSEKGKNAQSDTNKRLQEEVRKNKALFETFSLLKTERDKLSFDLKELQVLLANSQILHGKKQTELQNLQRDYALLETKVDNQAARIVNLEKQLAESQSQRDALTAQLTKPQVSLDECRVAVDKDTNKGKSYARQQITIEKLRDKVEDLEGQLRVEKKKNQQLQNLVSLAENNIKGTMNEEVERLRREIADKEARHEEISAQVAIAEERLGQVKDDLDEVSRGAAGLKLTNEVGTQVDGNEDGGVTREGRHLNKFTLANRPESPDSPSLDIESIGLGNLKNPACSTKSSYSIQCDSVLEVPSLDVNGFADDIIEELELSECSARKRLDRDELENKVTALTLRLVANSDSLSERIERQTETYRCQYEMILSLVRDISHRLRDHVCIGTAEPIVPVYVLLEEVKLHLRDLAQNASQVGVFICEDRMRRCWDLFINYAAILRQENEVLQNISRETTPTQTGLVRRRNRFTQDKPDPAAEPGEQRRRRLGRCWKWSAFLLIAVLLAMAVGLAINLTCRMSTSESQYCPLDSIARRINVGLPPM